MVQRRDELLTKIIDQKVVSKINISVGLLRCCINHRLMQTYFELCPRMIKSIPEKKQYSSLNLGRYLEHWSKEASAMPVMIKKRVGTE